jgi:serine-type D-Ala-D-Ala carboxypeptidase (penicillin-binding protein 5/6)
VSAKLFAALAMCLAMMASAQMPAAAQAADPLSSKAPRIAIMDFGTGQLLYCRDCETPMPPASMSKLMTILVVEDAIRAGKVTLDTELPVSENAWRHGAQSDGSHMFLELNSKVRVEDLIKGVVIVSANDACIVLAEGIAGSEEAFVALMNKRGRELGFKTAQFRNATGLPDPDHVISARDLASLARVLIKDYPSLYRFYGQPEFTFNGKTQQNRNPLLGAFEGADGVKTGHTNVSGYGLVGSAELNGQRRIVVFNGLNSMAERAAEGKRLMRAAFYDFAVTKLYADGDSVAEADVWLGAKKKVPLVATSPITIVAHRTVHAGLEARVVYDGPLHAPVKKGDVVARLVIEGGGVKEEFPLAAGEKVSRANPFARAAFGISRTFGGDES